MKKVGFAIALWLLIPRTLQAQGVISCSGSALASVAACLTPGQWGEVTGMTGWQNFSGGGSTIFNTYPIQTGDDSMISFQSKGTWNPQTREIFTYGGAHTAECGPLNCYKAMIKFNADTSIWSRVPLSTDVINPQSTGLHYYAWNALDQVNQDFYVRDYSISAGEFRGLKYHIPNGTWTTLEHNYSLNGAAQQSNFDAFEYFPDQDHLLWVNSTYSVLGGTGGILRGIVTQYNKTLREWEFTNGSVLDPNGSQAYNLPMGDEYAIAHYDPVHHVVYFGGGKPDFDNIPPYVTATRQLYSIDVHGIVTTLPLAPSTISTVFTLSAVDPVTGDLVVFTSDLHRYTYHHGDSFWTTTDVSATAPLINPGSGLLSNEVAIPDVTDRVILYIQHSSPTSIHLYVYKYDQIPSFTSKCALAGVLGCWPFDSSAELFYNWDANNTTLNSDPLLAGKFNYDISSLRNSGEGNSKAYNEFVSPPGGANSIASIDTSINFSGGGALKLPTPQYSLENVANFQDNFNKVLGHPNVAICKNATNCPLGNKIYLQFMARMSSSMVNDYVYECGLFGSGCYAGPLSSAGVNSTHVLCSGCAPGYGTGFCLGPSNPGNCTQSHAGKRLFLYDTNIGGHANIVTGTYTIVSVVNYNEVVLDRSPSPGGTQMINAQTLVENIQGGAGGWKVGIMLSNADATFGNDQIQEIVMNDGNQGKGPQVYGRKGEDSPGAYQVVYPKWIANTWQEVTIEIIVGDINVANTEVKWWLDGTQIGDWTTAILGMDGADNGVGLGQLNITPFQTQRDPFYQGSADGALWIDAMITSTSPIPFNSSGGGNVVPCSTPSKVVFTSQPSSAALGSSLGPVIAQIQDVTGVWCTTATNVVTLSKHTGATWNPLVSASDLTKNASGGLVMWNDLSVTTTTGSGSIDVNSAGLTGATSDSINITTTGCSSPSKLAFITQPSGAISGASLGTVTVQIRDSSDVPCTTATNTVTLSKNNGAIWGTLNSSSNLSKASTAGNALWNDLFVTGATGSGSIDANSSGLTAATSNSFTISNTIPSIGGGRGRRRPEQIRHWVNWVLLQEELNF